MGRRFDPDRAHSDRFGMTIMLIMRYKIWDLTNLIILKPIDYGIAIVEQ